MEPEPPKRRMSQRDIAKHLGVSHVTISLALRNDPRISEKVRHEIRLYADKIGYQPDPMLAALSSYRLDRSATPIHSAIAWINAWPQPEKLRAFKEFDLYWKGASAAATKFGYHLEEFQMGKDCSPKRLHQILQARGIQGILLPPHGSLDLQWGNFPWENYSIARFGRSVENPATHLVTSDQVVNTITAFHAMRKRGYRRIGFVTKDVDMNPRGHLFAAGFLGIQAMIDPGDRVPIFNFVDHQQKNLDTSLKQWVKKNQPDAILTSSGEVPDLLEKCGIRAPEDVGLAVLSLLDGGADSGIDQHPEEIGRVGFLLLNSLINDRARGLPTIFRQILVEGSWVDGTSLPPK